jgi:hypothetical protein
MRHMGMKYLVENVLGQWPVLIIPYCHAVSNDAGGCQAFLFDTSPEARASAPFRSCGKGFDVQTKAVFL